MLLLQRGHHRHHRFDKAGAFRALGPKAPLAPEDPWPNRPLGGVVRGLHPVVPHERPQGLPQLEQLPAGALRLGHPTRLARFQQPLHFLLGDLLAVASDVCLLFGDRLPTDPAAWHPGDPHYDDLTIGHGRLLAEQIAEQLGAVIVPS